MPAPPLPDPPTPQTPRSPPARPQLVLQTLDRGDGLLGLRPCGPVRPPARTPLFGARGPRVTLAWLQWAPPGATPDPAQRQQAEARLHAASLHPLPAEALQWRGAPALATTAAPWSLVREDDFGAFWADVLPALQAEGWAVDVRPGFAHAAQPVGRWQVRLQPLGPPPGLGGWLLSLGVELHTRDGVETLDLCRCWPA